ncbi:MAG: hydrogenase maturation nickel metallochaperone HypA [Algibacter sp.]|uniref:hydrogenase maturation nickel metallochaperone HypA n=1 Tax=Algibacter sp. TaxID=1872428 RepID=UPI0026315093|nr:hydrogenase maturation nickel metallochaperone HypA [Algibacter sp.]MDG1729168.1 hydrogenase maturation nickel metallochaperone HypA [Algibacter sp.]MDG2178425.1 hydrogenase maturation nickel metallochaperone HypA [Algibacter sp.]
MHELSIAMGIVDIAEKETAKAKANKVESIELEIGTLSGIEVDALEFVWTLAVEGTVLEHASKKIHIIKGEAKCSGCNTIFELKQVYDACPNCNSFLKAIIKGKELIVKALEVLQ